MIRPDSAPSRRTTRAPRRTLLDEARDERARRLGDTDVPAGGERFSMGLTLDVADVLGQHGYGPLNGGQIVELQQHLLHLLHGDPAGGCTGGVA